MQKHELVPELLLPASGQEVSLQGHLPQAFSLGNTGKIGYITQFVAKDLCKFRLELHNDIGIQGSFNCIKMDWS